VSINALSLGVAHNLSGANISGCIAIPKAIMQAEYYWVRRAICATNCPCLELANSSSGNDRSPLGAIFREIIVSTSVGIHQVPLRIMYSFFL
jgi:hypothetical protein